MKHKLNMKNIKEKSMVEEVSKDETNNIVVSSLSKSTFRHNRGEFVGQVLKILVPLNLSLEDSILYLS